MFILAVGICCLTILLLLHWSAGIAALQLQGDFCAITLHVFLPLLHCTSKGFKGKASLHCPNILVVAPIGGGECSQGKHPCAQG